MKALTITKQAWLEFAAGKPPMQSFAPGNPPTPEWAAMGTGSSKPYFVFLPAHFVLVGHSPFGLGPIWPGLKFGSGQILAGAKFGAQICS